MFRDRETGLKTGGRNRIDKIYKSAKRSSQGSGADAESLFLLIIL